MPALYIAYRGIPEDPNLRLSAFTGRGPVPHFVQLRVLSDRASWEGPALAAFGGKLYMAWRGGTEDDQRLFWASAELHQNDLQWSEQRELTDRGSSWQPTMAVHRDRLFMAWRGVNDDQQIFWATFDGSNWSLQQVLDDRGSFQGGPALAEFDGELVMAWRGVEFDHRIFWATFRDGWSPQRVLPDRASQDGPALCVFEDKLYMFWRGPREDRRLFFSSLNRGDFTWSGQQTLQPLESEKPLESEFRPVAAVYRKRLYLVHVGKFDLGDEKTADDNKTETQPATLAVIDPRLRYTTFDGQRPALPETLVGDGTRASAGIAVFPNERTRSLKRFLIIHGFDPARGMKQAGSGSLQDLMAF